MQKPKNIVQEVCDKLNISQAELSRMIGVSPSEFPFFSTSTIKRTISSLI